MNRTKLAALLTKEVLDGVKASEERLRTLYQIDRFNFGLITGFEEFGIHTGDVKPGLCEAVERSLGYASNVKWYGSGDCQAVVRIVNPERKQAMQDASTDEQYSTLCEAMFALPLHFGIEFHGSDLHTRVLAPSIYNLGGNSEREYSPEEEAFIERNAALFTAEGQLPEFLVSSQRIGIDERLAEQTYWLMLDDVFKASLDDPEIMRQIQTAYEKEEKIIRPAALEKFYGSSIVNAKERKVEPVSLPVNCWTAPTDLPN